MDGRLVEVETTLAMLKPTIEKLAGSVEAFHATANDLRILVSTHCLRLAQLEQQRGLVSGRTFSLALLIVGALLGWGLSKF